MNLHLAAAVVIIGSTLSLVSPSAAQSADAGRQPRVLVASSVDPEKNAQLSPLIAEIRGQADAFVFLSGGASRIRRSELFQVVALHAGASGLRDAIIRVLASEPAKKSQP